MDWNICVQAINGPFRKPMFLPASTQTAAHRLYYKTIIGYYYRALAEKRLRCAIFSASSAVGAPGHCPGRKAMVSVARAVPWLL